MRPATTACRPLRFTENNPNLMGHSGGSLRALAFRGAMWDCLPSVTGVTHRSLTDTVCSQLSVPCKDDAQHSLVVGVLRPRERRAEGYAAAPAVRPGFPHRGSGPEGHQE